MPRTNDRINPKFHHSAILVVGCPRAQSNRNSHKYFGLRTQNCFPTLALAVGRKCNIARHEKLETNKYFDPKLISVSYSYDSF